MKLWGKWVREGEFNIIFHQINEKFDILFNLRPFLVVYSGK